MSEDTTFRARGLKASQIFGENDDGFYITDPNNPGDVVVVFRITDGSAGHAVYQVRVKDGVDYPFPGPLSSGDAFETQCIGKLASEADLDAEADSVFGTGNWTKLIQGETFAPVK